MWALSIRRRLVLSYALLAVLTVSVVGALALGLIRSNLAQRETELLTMNAQAVARQAARSIQPCPTCIACNNWPIWQPSSAMCKCAS